MSPFALELLTWLHNNECVIGQYNKVVQTMSTMSQPRYFADIFSLMALQQKLEAMRSSGVIRTVSVINANKTVGIFPRKIMLVAIMVSKVHQQQIQIVHVSHLSLISFS